MEELGKEGATTVRQEENDTVSSRLEIGHGDRPSLGKEAGLNVFEGM